MRPFTGAWLVSPCSMNRSKHAEKSFVSEQISSKQQWEWEHDEGPPSAPVVRVALGKHLCGAESSTEAFQGPSPQREQHERPLRWLEFHFFFFSCSLFFSAPQVPRCTFIRKRTTEAPGTGSPAGHTGKAPGFGASGGRVSFVFVSTPQALFTLSQARVITTEENNDVWMHVDCSAHSNNCPFAWLNYTFVAL